MVTVSRTNGPESIKASRRGAIDNGGPPDTTAHTVSPRMKALLGVMQFAANVSTEYGLEPACGNSAEKRLDVTPRLVLGGLAVAVLPFTILFLFGAEAESDRAPPRP